MLLGLMPAQGADAGRDIFRNGVSGRQACAGCHGRDGQGGSEGTLRAPAVTWEGLTREQGYDPASLGVALAKGIAADGRRLSGMPRYVLTEREVAKLAGYLGRLPQDDEGGVSADRITVAALSLGADDQWPALFAAAMERHSRDRPIFSRNVLVVPIEAKIGASLPGPEIFIAVGLPAAYPSAISDALAASGIPNVLPRGFLSGNEAQGEGVGWLPSLSQIVSAAERRAECGLEPPLLVASDAATAIHLNRALGTLGGKPPACRIVAGLRGDNTLPFAVLQTPTGLLHFDPARREPGAAALVAFADKAAERIVSALMAAGTTPTRTRFLSELARTAGMPAIVPEFR